MQTIDNNDLSVFKTHFNDADFNTLITYITNASLHSNPSNRILYIYGKGGCGKTTLCNMIKRILSKNNVYIANKPIYDNTKSIHIYNLDEDDTISDYSGILKSSLNENTCIIVFELDLPNQSIDLGLARHLSMIQMF